MQLNQSKIVAYYEITHRLKCYELILLYLDTNNIFCVILDFKLYFKAVKLFVIILLLNTYSKTKLKHQDIAKITYRWIKVL